MNPEIHEFSGDELFWIVFKKHNIYELVIKTIQEYFAKIKKRTI